MTYKFYLQGLAQFRQVAILAIFGGYFCDLAIMVTSFFISMTVMDGIYIVLGSFWRIALYWQIKSSGEIGKKTCVI